jgi:hypothetical protein
MMPLFFHQLFCNHEYITKGRGGRMYVSCLKCGRDSEGIEVGGVRRVQSNTERALAVANTFRPRRKR